MLMLWMLQLLPVFKHKHVEDLKEEPSNRKEVLSNRLSHVISVETVQHDLKNFGFA